MQLIYANLDTLPTSQGVGHHGHIGAIMNPMLYTTPEFYPKVPANYTMIHQDQL